MPLQGNTLQGFSLPNDRLGVTQWRQFLASDIASEVNSGLKTSIADVNGELQYRGSTAASGQYKVSTAYQGIAPIINPDTGDTVTWSDGEFLGMEVWLKYGTEIPAATREGFTSGVIHTSSSTVLTAGTTYSSSAHKVTTAKWSSSSAVSMTWGTDDRIWGYISMPPQAGGSNVLIDLANAIQLDDATTPARVQSSVNTVLSLVTSADLGLLVAIGGDIDVQAYYRLIKVPVAPA